MLASRAFSARTSLQSSRAFSISKLQPLLCRTLTASSMTGNTSVSDAVKHDHREIEQYYDQIINATDADTKTRYQNLFTWELARHSIGEELVVYPALEKYVDGGKAMADRDRQEHRKVKEMLYKFQQLSPSDNQFEPTIKRLMSDLAEHIKEEETEDLVKLEQAVPTAESRSLAASFKRTKMFVPTRSHPSAPDKPPFETVAGLLAAPIDKLGDIFRKFPKE
ncbi:HHE domain-containing protein [Cryptococcus bacillisporus CA1873]|uniref:Unplaced genomic scaffold supercont1.1, whole genome shotgun sequence n=3 Tax=Cryptococcus gattii TaxID=552467 RepID=A0A0D0VYC6_CRYGA|nr:HHE domain-containing protein [Cryptococcus bacillisporus CA1280]KIR67354.1 HHE domain-containing protein [Cryptococcus bacillisporus CA1873]|eukprot:KIR67354.1 HHE domain-containing protein [Cryptococcus gattii CA1873]